jgi:hypothetical protein
MSVHKGSCHCGAVEFEVDTDLAGAIQCDCSLCRRKNAVMIRIPGEKFRLVKGEDALTLYQWNTRVAKHYFCKHCGIYTHHTPRTRPDMVGFNAGCLDDVNARGLEITFAEGSKLSGGREA